MTGQMTPKRQGLERHWYATANEGETATGTESVKGSERATDKGHHTKKLS